MTNADLLDWDKFTQQLHILGLDKSKSSIKCKIKNLKERFHRMVTNDFIDIWTGHDKLFIETFKDLVPIKKKNANK
jgi:hypothetical protein